MPAQQEVVGARPDDRLVVHDLSLTFAGVKSLDGLSLVVESGMVCGLIGPNGAGKTTLFNCISRIYQPDRGTLAFNGRDLLALEAHEVVDAGIARTFQHLVLFPELTVLDNVLVGAHSKSQVGFLRAALNLGAAGDDRRLRERAMEILRFLRLDHLALERCAGHPYGTLKRIDIARALASEPRLLLLDEPANGLTEEEVHELATLVEQIRADRGTTVVLVEHHMGMVLGTCDHVIVLNAGRKLAEGAPDAVAQDPQVIEAYLGVPA